MLEISRARERGEKTCCLPSNYYYYKVAQQLINKLIECKEKEIKAVRFYFPGYCDQYR